MKRLLKIILAIPIIAVLLFVSAYFASPLINNYRLSDFANQFNNTNLPTDIELIEVNSICGKLTGNGNGFDYLACSLVKTNLTLEELHKRVSKVNFKPAKSSSTHSVEVEVLPVKGVKLQTQYLEHGELVFNELKSLTAYDGYYYIVISDGGYDAGFDIRGH